MFESDERLIVEKIKEYIKDKGSIMYYHIIMLRNGQILDIIDYRDMVSDGKITPQDAYVYIIIHQALSRTSFHYPFLTWYSNIVDAYLLKLGFHYDRSVVPATGLKYVAFAVGYENYLAIELLNLDTIVNNTNLPKIVVEVLGKKLISGEKELTREEYIEIRDTFISQKLFAGYNFDKAWNIVNNYYDEGNQSLVKEVARIVIAYVDIFHPYKVCYDMDSWKEIDCWSIK